MPTDAEISNMEGFVEAMQPFSEITEVIGKQKTSLIFISSVFSVQVAL